MSPNLGTESRPSPPLQESSSISYTYLSDPDLSKAWLSAREDFLKVTGQTDLASNVTGPSTSLGIEDVVKNIAATADEWEKRGTSALSEPQSALTATERKKRARKMKARDVVMKVLGVVDTLGKVAGQGVAMVFGPSELCFNALSFLITSAQKVSKLFTSVVTLLERVAIVLDRFEIYLRNQDLDIKLRRVAYRLLLSVVSICNVTIKIAKEPRMLLFAKVVALDSDEGVKDELEKLEQIIKEETSINIALIYEQVRKTEVETLAIFGETHESLKNLNGKVENIEGGLGSITTLLERQTISFQQENIERISRKNREIVQKALDIKGDYWAKHLKQYLSRKTESTGNWLLDDSTFQSWKDGGSESSILVLEGNEGHGKSYLCSAVIGQLLRHEPHKDQSPAVATAYYFFSPDEDDSINKMLRSIIWQLANAQPEYLDAVAKASANLVEFENNDRLWTELVLAHTNINATFYICLDGLSDEDLGKKSPLAKVLASISENHNKKGLLKIRVFLTARPRAARVLRRDERVVIKFINVSKRNESDILAYINEKMYDTKVFKAADQSELREQVQKILIEKAKGDYVKINLALEEMSTKSRRREIDAILERAGDDRLETVHREIKRLNSLLTTEDIHDLNEVLLWVIGLRKPISMVYLEELMTWKHGETSLTPLADEVPTKYEYLFQIRDGYVFLRSPVLEGYLKSAAKRTEHITERDHSRPTKGEVAIVERFLRTVCDQELYDKFEFADFFRKKLSREDFRISIPAEGELAVCVLDKLLSILSSRSVSSYLLEFAVGSLDRAMRNVDLAMLAPNVKTTLGVKLMAAFQGMGKEFHSLILEGRGTIRWKWIYDDKPLECVMEWLRDPAVSRSLSDEERDWVKSLLLPASEKHLLDPIMRFCASQWLGQSYASGSPGPERETHYGERFQTLYAHVIKVMWQRDPSVKRMKEDVYTRQSSYQEIQLVEAWAAKELKASEPDALWHRNVAITCLTLDLFPEAIERSRLALEREPDSLPNLALLAEAYGSNKEHEKALSLYNQLVSRYKADPTLIEEGPVYYYEEILTRLGQLHLQLNHPEDALLIFKDVCQNYQWLLGGTAAKKMIETLHKLHKYSEMKEFFETLKSQKQLYLGDDLSCVFIKHYDEKIHIALSDLTLHLGSADYVIETFEQVIEDKKQRMWKDWQIADIQFSFARFLSQLNDLALRSRTLALLESLTAVGHDLSECSLPDGSIWAAEHLGRLYLTLAREVEFEQRAVQDYIRRSESNISIGGHTSYEQAQFHETELLLARLLFLAAKKHSGDLADQYMAQAKKLCREQIEYAFHMLSDEYETNDRIAFEMLERICAVLDEATAVTDLCRLRLLGHFDRQEELEGAAKKRRTNDIDYCSNYHDCDKKLIPTEDLYICLDFTYQLCANCYKRHLDGQLVFEWWRSSADFLLVPALTTKEHQELSKLPREMIKIEDEVVELDTWIAGVERRWEVERKLGWIWDAETK